MYSAAAIDVGSNAIRLAWVRIGPSGALRGQGFERFAIRLGEDAFRAGVLQEKTIDRLLGVFRAIASSLERESIDDHRAVATSAMREVRNRVRVCKRIKASSGIRLEVIQGEEESRLARDALVMRLGRVPKSTLMIDLGGGSLELERLGRTGGCSLPLGTVRLLETTPELKGTIPKKRWEFLSKQLHRLIREELRACWRRTSRTTLAVGTGGNLDTLARLVPDESLFFPTIDVGKLPELSRKLSSMTPEARSHAWGLRRDRADLILPAAVVVDSLAQTFGFKQLVVPGTGLREAILHRLIAARVSDRSSSAEKFAASWLPGKKKSQARHRLERLVRELYEALLGTHGLWHPASDILRCAAVLHDVGTRIDPLNPRAHSAYVIEHSRDLKMEPTHRRLVAEMVRLSLDLEKPLPECYPAEEQAALRSLAALLHLGLLLRERGAVRLREVNVVAQPARLHFGLENALRKKELQGFEKVLGRTFQVT